MDEVSESDRVNDLLGSKMLMTLSKFSDASFNLTDLVVNTELNNIQQMFFHAYQGFIRSVSGEPEKMQENLDAFLQSSGLTQFKASPELNFSAIKGKLNEGSFSGLVNSNI